MISSEVQSGDDEHFELSSKATKTYQDIAQVLKLDKLILHLDLTGLLYRKLAAGQLPWFKIFRNFNIARSFEVQTLIFTNGDEADFDSDYDENDYREENSIGRQTTDSTTPPSLETPQLIWILTTYGLEHMISHLSRSNHVFGAVFSGTPSNIGSFSYEQREELLRKPFQMSTPSRKLSTFSGGRIWHGRDLKKLFLPQLAPFPL